MANSYDIAILGGGPAGYTAALWAASKGAKVAIVEKAHIGGTCLNVGCIPTKTLLAHAHLFGHLVKGRDYGINVAEPNFDALASRERKDRVVTQLRDGLMGLLKNARVEIYQGQGRLADKGITIQSNDNSTQDIYAKGIILASGSVVAKPPIPGIDSSGIITSEDALDLGYIPNRLLIIGGGAEGVEFADYYQRVGCQVTLVEALPTLIPLEDEDLGRQLRRSLQNQGIEVLVNSPMP